MEEFEQLYNSLLQAGKNEDDIYSSLVLSGYNSSQVRSYMDYAKKKSKAPTKEYGQSISQKYYLQSQEDGSVSQSTSGFGKPLSESSLNAITRVDFDPVGEPVDGVQQYKPTSQIQVGEPRFGAEAAAVGEVHKPLQLPDGSKSSIHDFMRLDPYEEKNFMNSLELTVPEEKRSAFATMYNAPKFTDDAGETIDPQEEAIRTLDTYKKKYVNDRIKSAVSGKFEEGQDPLSVEKFLQEEYGYRTLLDDIDFVGDDMSSKKEGFVRMMNGFRPISDQMLVGSLKMFASLAGDKDVDDYVEKLSTEIDKDINRESEEFELGMPKRYMSDNEADDIEENVERFLGFSTEEVVKTMESAPVTLSSLAAAMASYVGTVSATKNPVAAGNAAAFAQATVMGLAVHGQEYMSTYSDPTFYDYFTGSGEKSTMEDATEIDEQGNLVVKDGYYREHDKVRAGGYASTAAMSEFAGEFVGNKIIIGGSRALVAGRGMRAPGRLIQDSVKKSKEAALLAKGTTKTAAASTAKAYGRAARYAAGMSSAIFLGSLIEGGEETITEHMQHVARINGGRASSGPEFYRNLYNSFINPSEELKRNRKQAFKSGVLMGAFLPIGAGTASIVNNERQIKKANDALRSNKLAVDRINKKFGTSFTPFSVMKGQGLGSVEFFGSDAEMKAFEQNRELYSVLQKNLLANVGLIQAGMSRKDRKVYNEQMKKLEDLFKSANENGEIQIEALASILPSIASKIDALRGDIFMSENIVNSLVEMSKQGDIVSTQFLFDLMKNQLDLRAMVMSSMDSNITDEMESYLKSEIEKLEATNSELVKKAYDQAEGKGFRYTFIENQTDASKPTLVKEKTRVPNTENEYIVRITNANEERGSVATQGTETASGESRFTYSELGEGATEVSLDTVDDLSLSDEQKSRLRTLMESSPNARVIIHDSQDSIDKAGDRAGLKGNPAFTLQDNKGRVFEIHLKEDFTSEIADEEFGHYEFNEELYKDEVREPMIAAINKAIKENPNSPLAEFVRSHNSKMSGNSQKIIEIELLTNLGRVISRKEGSDITGETISAKDVESLLDPNRSNFRDYVKRFDRYLKGKGKVKEMAYDPSQVDNEGSVEGTAASYKPTFLDGKTVYGYIPLSQFDATRNLEVSAKIKDYNHFRNWYAKMTGNHKRRLYNLSFQEDNGNRVRISSMPGHEVTEGRPLDWRGKELFYKRDYNTKEIIPMEPVALTFPEKRALNYEREQDQIKSRNQSRLNRFNNLNNLAMESMGMNVYTFAQRIPGIEQAVDEQGYKSGFTEESIEKIEVALAAELGVMPLTPQRVTLPVPRVPKNMSGDIVEGTANSAKLPTIQYAASEERALLKRFGVDKLTDIDIAQLQGEYLHPALAIAILGSEAATIQFDKYAGMRPNLSILRITPEGNPSMAKASMTSGSSYLANKEADRDGMTTIAANTDPSAAGVIRSAVSMAEENNEPLIIGYLSLAQDNVFSDPGGFEFLMKEIVTWHLDKYKDTPLTSGKTKTTMVEAIAEGINSAIRKKGMKNIFLPEATEDAQKNAGVRYPFSATSTIVEKKGFKGEVVLTTEANVPQLAKDEFGSYSENQVREAIKLILSMSDQYESIMVSRAGFGGRKTIATSILSKIKDLENPNQKPKGKNTSRRFLFSDGRKTPNAISHYTGLMNDTEYQQNETHVYAVVKPDVVSSRDFTDSKETYRFAIKANKEGVYFFRSKPEYGLNEETLFGRTFGANVKKGAEKTLFEVDGTANSRRLGRISYTNGSSWQASDPTGFGKALDAVALKLQDKYHDVMLLQKDIEEFRGRRMSEGNDFNLAVDLMYGKTRNDLDVLDSKLDDIKSSMKAEDVKSDDLSDFLYAMHARERNAKIEFDRPDMESGSGMTNEEAEEIIDRLGTNAMRRLASEVRSIIQDTRDTMRKFGLETDETVDVYENMYDYYVPLSGLATDEMDDSTNAYPTGGIGMAVYGPTTRQAKGRKSKTDVNIIAQVVMQNARVKQLARKNEALLSLHSMFSGNPNKNLFSLWGPKNRMQTVEKNGKPRNMSDSEMRARRDMIPVRINGEQHFIQFKNEHYANTINGLSVDPTNIITNAMRKPAQWLRNVFTVYDPNFFVTNFSRDVQSALYNALAEAERADGTVSGVRVGDLTKKLISNTSMSLRGLLNENAFGKDMSPELKQYFEEWRESGGQTGWGYNKDIDAIIKELSDDAKKGLPSKVWKTAKDVANYVEGVNEAFENSVRLSAYMSARQLGVTKDRAAQLSKNITVNFNRSGEWGSTLNSVYLFFNAAMQGNARILRSMVYMKDTKKPNGELESWHKRTTLPQKVAFGMTTLSGMITMMNLAFSDEDEDGELFYNKISDYEKERNLIIMTGGKGYLKVPLPYGYNLFNNLGVMMTETASGHRDADDAMMFLATSAVSSFSPISFGQSDNAVDYATKAVMPTVLKPMVEIGMNETYFGDKVYMEQLPFGTPRPESQMSFRSPEQIQEFFTWLNEATGGSKYKSGDVDINFDPYWYVFEYLGGGSGRFINQAGKAVYDVGQAAYAAGEVAYESEDIPSFMRNLEEKPMPQFNLSRMPLARKVYGEASRYYDYDLFEENAEEIRQLKKELRELPVTDPLRYKGVNPLYGKLRETEKLLTQLRKYRIDARDIEDYIQRSNRITSLMEAERRTIVDFNKSYEQKRGEKD